MVEGEGFEPPKAEGRQVYSLVRLAASLPLLNPVLAGLEPVARLERATFRLQGGCSTP